MSSGDLYVLRKTMFATTLAGETIILEKGASLVYLEPLPYERRFRNRRWCNTLILSSQGVLAVYSDSLERRGDRTCVSAT